MVPGYGQLQLYINGAQHFQSLFIERHATTPRKVTTVKQ